LPSRDGRPNKKIACYWRGGVTLLNFLWGGGEEGWEIRLSIRSEKEKERGPLRCTSLPEIKKEKEVGGKEKGLSVLRKIGEKKGKKELPMFSHPGENKMRREKERDD